MNIFNRMAHCALLHVLYCAYVVIKDS